MLLDLVKNFIQNLGSRFLQLDVALPEPLETKPPVTAPGTPDAAPLLRILLPVLAAVVIIVLLCLLYRRHRKNKPEAEKNEEE